MYSLMLALDFILCLSLQWKVNVIFFKVDCPDGSGYCLLWSWILWR